MRDGVVAFAGAQLPGPEFEHVGAGRSDEQRRRSAPRPLPQRARGRRGDDGGVRRTSQVHQIGNRCAECRGDLAQRPNRGIRRAALDLHEHPFADVGPGRQLIERKAALASSRLDVPRDGLDDIRLLRDACFLRQYIDRCGHYVVSNPIMTPEVNAAVWALRPDYVALSIVVRGGRNEARAAHMRTVSANLPRPAWAEPHLASWREAYKAFGAKPQRTPCAAEALWRRLQRDGTLGSINAIVDLYNAVSVRYAVPVGGEDLSAYVGAPRLVRAVGDEPFETTREGQPAIELVEPGEVVWRDDRGVTCRRWNWRQTTRTHVGVASTDLWFVLERLEPMPIDALLEAGESIVQGVRNLATHAEITTRLIREGD